MSKTKNILTTSDLQTGTAIPLEAEVKWQKREQIMLENEIREIKKEVLIKIIVNALEEIYKDEVIDTDMQTHIIGERKDYETKEDWQISKLYEWARD